MEKYKKNIPQYKYMKTLVVVLVGLFLLGLGLAITNGTQKNISLDVEHNDVLDSLNNDSIMRGNITCDDTRCWQKMWKGDYNLGTTTINKIKCHNYRLYNLDDNSTTDYKDLDLFINIIIENANSTTPIAYSYNCTEMRELKDEKLIEEMSKQQAKGLEEIAKNIVKRQEKQDNETIISDHGPVVINEVI